jgi:hypothetical protein
MKDNDKSRENSLVNELKCDFCREISSKERVMPSLYCIFLNTYSQSSVS